MTENPYQSPQTTDDAWIAGASAATERIRKVAHYQKGVIACIGAHFVMPLIALLMPSGTQAIIMVLAIGMLMVGVGYFFMLAIQLYGMAFGIVAGLLLFVPIVNLICLLAVSRQASLMLRLNGIRVGLLGAKSLEPGDGR